jgi:hypothetical protein
MNATIRDRDVIAVVRALDAAGEFNRRAKSCPPQHRRGLYRRKDMALQEALMLGPGQFYVDSTDGGDPPILGVTHKYSARRFHIRPDMMPLEIQDALAEMSMSAEIDSGVCEMQSAGR